MWTIVNKWSVKDVWMSFRYCLQVITVQTQLRELYLNFVHNHILLKSGMFPGGEIRLSIREAIPLRKR